MARPVTLWQQVRDALPPGAHFQRISASADSEGRWYANVEALRYHGQGGSWYEIGFNGFTVEHWTVETALDAALADLLSKISTSAAGG